MEFIKTFQAAAGPHWIRTGVVIGSVAYAITTGIETALEARGFTIVPTFPKLVFTAGALIILLLFWGWKYAHLLRMAAEPAFSLSFEGDGGVGIAPAIIRNQVLGSVIAGSERKGNYVRIRVDAVSATNVVGCRAFIIGFAKKLPTDTAFVTIQLPQTISIVPGPFDVLPHIPHRIDFLMTPICWCPHQMLDGRTCSRRNFESLHRFCSMLQ